MLLDYAKIVYDGSSVKSENFDDIYFSGDGFAETEHVFIKGNNLEEKFAHLPSYGKFAIAELGFGTGLNFFITAQLFLNTAPKNAVLTYCSCEKYPIKLEDLKNIQRDWDFPQLKERLYKQYPDNHTGFHLLKIHPRINLLLLLGDAQSTLPELNGEIDAWFLDGFAPGKNPELWTDGLIGIIARKSKKSSSFATYSVAGSIREKLTAAGFIVEKLPGYAQKKEMLVGKYAKDSEHLPFWTDIPTLKKSASKVAIIGAGFAGATTARALADKAVSVDVFFDNKLYPPASAIPLAIPYFQPGLIDTPMRRFHLQSWHHTNRILQILDANGEYWKQQEITLKAFDEDTRRRHRKIFAQNLLNEQNWKITNADDIVFLKSGVIDSHKLLDTLLQHENINLISKAIDNLSDLDNANYDAIVIATSWRRLLLPEGYYNEIRPLRGQALILKNNNPPPVTCGRYTVLPSLDKKHSYIGSVYQPNDIDGNVKDLDREELMNAYKSMFPDSIVEYDEDFANVRASAKDYFPFVGPLPKVEAMRRDYEKWQKDTNIPINASLQWQEPPLYMHSGLGSKGCLTSFLSAELIAAMICNTVLPVPESLLARLLPARAIIKSIVRGS